MGWNFECDDLLRCERAGSKHNVNRKNELKDQSIGGGEEVWENSSVGGSHQKTCLCEV